MGFEYDLLKRFAEELGVDLEMVIVQNMDSILPYLNRGVGDLAAANLTITQQRSEDVSFSKPILTTSQVLIQRLPARWYQLPRKVLDTVMLRDTSQLIGKTITVRLGSSFYERMTELNRRMGGGIHIEATTGQTTEWLIKAVSQGEIDYTVADEHIALLNKAYYPNIDVQLALSDEDSIGWAVPSPSTELRDTLNDWLERFRGTKSFAMIELKYFKARTQQKRRMQSAYNSVEGGKISPYDELLKQQAQRMGWDWRLLAAMVKKESNFNPRAQSPFGACGLMQLMPATAHHYGADSIFDPVENVHAGVSYLMKVNRFWEQQIADSTERIAFVLASYNAGLGHVKDAQRLAIKYGQNDRDWEVVSHYLSLKSRPDFYRDPVVKHGYCRGIEPVSYVDRVMDYWEHYRKVY